MPLKKNRRMPLILVPILAGVAFLTPASAFAAMLSPEPPKTSSDPMYGLNIDLQNYTGGCNVAIPLACPKEKEESKTGETRLPDGWYYVFVTNPPELRKRDGSKATQQELEQTLAEQKKRDDEKKAREKDAARKKEEADKLAALEKQQGRGESKPANTDWSTPKNPPSGGGGSYSKTTGSDGPAGGGLGLLSKSGGNSPSGSGNSRNAALDNFEKFSGGDLARLGSGAGAGGGRGEATPTVVGARADALPSKQPGSTRVEVYGTGFETLYKGIEGVNTKVIPSGLQNLKDNKGNYEDLDNPAPVWKATEGQAPKR